MPSNHFILCRPFLLPPSIFPSIRVFSNESALRTSAGQSTGASASASILLKKFQDWFPLGLTGCIFSQTKGLSRVSTKTTVQMHQFFTTQSSLWSNSHICTCTFGKNIALTIRIFVGKMMFLLFNMLSRFVITFLSRSNHLLISWLLYALSFC